VISNQPGGNYIIREIMRRYPEFEEEFSPKVKRLATQCHLCSDLHTSMAINTLDDLEGKVIGCQSSEGAKLLSALGASTTITAAPDMYTAGERGVLDGVLGAWGLVSSRHLWEVFHYHTPLSLSPHISHWCMNRETWDKFTEEEQHVFELLEPHLQYAIAIGNGTMVMNVLEEHVVGNPDQHIIELPPEDIATIKSSFESYWDEYAEDMEAKGLPGRDILNDILLLAKVHY
jgi:hypothetical protein